MAEQSPKHLLISVVIVAFNEEKYLPVCLAALKAQSFPKDDYEVTVVDNNSTDKTSEIAKEFGAKVISEKKQGYVFALNRGMREASSDIIAVTDADTKVSPNWLSTIKEAFIEENVVAVTGISKIKTGINIFDFLANCVSKLCAVITLMIGKPNVNGFKFAVRKDAFEKVGGLNEKFLMSPDVDLGIRLTKIGSFFHLLREVFTKRLSKSLTFPIFARRIPKSTSGLIKNSSFNPPTFINASFLTAKLNPFTFGFPIINVMTANNLKA